MNQDSPEDRLLRLIKKDTSPNRENGIHKAVFARKGAFFTDLGRKIFLKRKVFKPSFFNPINKTLPVILVVLLAYLVYSFLFVPQKNMKPVTQKEKTLTAKDETGIEAKKPQTAAHVEDYSVYSKAIKGKELFSASHISEVSQASAAQRVDISKRFSLVGIIAGVKPQAIIEDVETQKTYYLYENQSFNGITVAKISDGQAILNNKGKEIILVL